MKKIRVLNISIYTPGLGFVSDGKLKKMEIWLQMLAMDECKQNITLHAPSKTFPKEVPEAMAPLSKT
jgi:hypothetical protein